MAYALVAQRLRDSGPRLLRFGGDVAVMFPTADHREMGVGAPDVLAGFTLSQGLLRPISDFALPPARV